MAVNGLEWATTPEIITEGGATDLWNTTWTQAEVTASGFGFCIRAEITAGSGTRTSEIDFVRCRIYCTTPAGASIAAKMHHYRMLRR